MPDFRAGSVTLHAGFGGVLVFFLPMPTNNYRVSVTFTSPQAIAGSTATCEDLIDGCVFVQVSQKTFTSFMITLRSPETGAISPTPFNATLDWIAIQDQGQTGQQDVP